MCGRYASTRTDEELRGAFGVQHVEGTAPEANFNVAPNNDVRIVHDRMPLIVPPERLGDWLDPHTQEPDEVRGLLDAMPEPSLVPRKVSTLMNNVRNNGPELLAPVAS